MTTHNETNINDIFRHPLRAGDRVTSLATGPAVAWGIQRWVGGELILWVSPTDGRDESRGTVAWLLPVRDVTGYERREEARA
jgi:hypothetical protein